MNHTAVILGRAKREPGIQAQREALHAGLLRCALTRALDSGLRLRRPQNDGGWVRLVGALLALLLCFAAPAFAAPTFPPLNGRVVDAAHILTPQIVAQLTQKSADLETKTHHQFVVVTVPDLQGYPIEDYGYQLGRAWGIGGKGENDGVLLIVAPTARKVRIEVGYGLEPILTDALSSVILQTRVLPKFRAGDMEGGVVDGADAIVTQLGLDPAEAQKIAQQAAAKPRKSGGGFPVFLIVLIVFWIIMSNARRHGRGSGLGAALPWIILGGMNSGRGSSWRGGGGSSWGGGGGGFSGGGGSFGGGGSSGSW